MADKKSTLPAVRAVGTQIAGTWVSNLEREDILLPRLVLLQPMSPAVMEREMRSRVRCT